MNPSFFTSVGAGKLIKTTEGHWAFVPNPLPPKISWNVELANILSSADHAIGKLAGVGQALANPHLLIGPFMRREAILSSRIEGTQASLSDLVLFEASPSTEKNAPDVREVSNYVVALEHGLRRQRHVPINLRLIREMHAYLMAGVRGDEMTPGEFRNRQVWIGRGNSPIEQATFVPTPPLHLMETLDAFEKYLHSPIDLPPLVRLALIHYQFEAIHPFLDGNGRIGRLLISLLLCAQGILSRPLLYLSAYFERYREDYYRHLLNVSQQGRWVEWITFFLQGVGEQATDATARAQRLMTLRDDFHSRCQKARSSALLFKLVDSLFSSPSITLAGTVKLLQVTPRAAWGNIVRLIDAGIVQEVTGQKRNRVWIAWEIVRATEESPVIGES